MRRLAAIAEYLRFFLLALDRFPYSLVPCFRSLPSVFYRINPILFDELRKRVNDSFLWRRFRALIGVRVLVIRRSISACKEWPRPRTKYLNLNLGLGDRVAS